MSLKKPVQSLVTLGLGGIGGATALAAGKAMQHAEANLEAPGAPPVIEDTQAKAQAQADMLRRRKGRAASILTSPNKMAAPTTAAKQLLGE